jgi:acetylornithine deacetylase/succinyl-diaminopimelate desuccinylase-like protein
LEVGEATVYPVQVAEKGMCWIRARARGPSGHGSMPREDNAVVALARFLDRAGSRRLPLRPSPPVERFVRELAATQPLPARKVLPLLLNPRLSGIVLDRLVSDASVRCFPESDRHARYTNGHARYAKAGPSGAAQDGASGKGLSQPVIVSLVHG